MSLYALILCIDFVVFYLLIFFVLSLVVIIFVFFIVFLEKVQYMERGFMYWKKIAFGCSWWYLLAFIYVLAGSYLCISMRWFWLFLAIFQGFPNNGKGWGGKSPRPYWVKGKEPEEEWFWLFDFFSKIKTALCEYWTSIKIKINMTWVLKQHDIKTTMQQEQWLQLKMLFLSKFSADEGVGGPPSPFPVGKTLCFAGSYLCMNKFCKVDCI